MTSPLERLIDAATFRVSHAMNDARQQDGAAQSRCALIGGSLSGETPTPVDMAIENLRLGLLAMKKRQPALANWHVHQAKNIHYRAKKRAKENSVVRDGPAAGRSL